MRDEQYFIAEVWGWSPVEVREMFISERKGLIHKKLETEENRKVDLLDRSIEAVRDGTVMER